MKEEHIIIGGIDFTLTEFDILKLVMRGLPRKEIAAEREVALGTIDTHLRHIYQKTGIRKVTELIGWGFSHGFDQEGNYKEKKD